VCFVTACNCHGDNSCGQCRCTVRANGCRLYEFNIDFQRLASLPERKDREYNATDSQCYNVPNVGLLKY